MKVPSFQSWIDTFGDQPPSKSTLRVTLEAKMPGNSKGGRTSVLDIPITQEIRKVLGALYQEQRSKRPNVRTKDSLSTPVYKDLRSSVSGTKVKDIYIYENYIYENYI